MSVGNTFSGTAPSQTQDDARYLQPSTAAGTYLTQSNAASTYLSQTSAAANFMPSSYPSPLESTTTPFYIAHRGGAAIRPEHTMAAYAGAIAAGATAIEVSVQPLADGTWVCQHDATWDRATNVAGNVNARFYADVKNNVLVDIGAQQHGPSWANQPVTLLQDVLAEFGGKVIILVEPKATLNAVGANYANLLALMLKYGPPHSYIWKIAALQPNGGIPPSATAAQAAGVKAWAYLGGGESNAFIDATAAATDIIGTVASTADATQSYIVSKGKPVIAYSSSPLFTRRWQATHLNSLGVYGIMTSIPEYHMRSIALNTTSQFGTGVRAPGDLPYNDAFGSIETWNVSDNSLTLTAGSTNNGLSLGSMSPVANAASSYTITFQFKWTTLPSPTTNNAEFVICHADDLQYIFQGTANNPGYHCVIRASGGFQVNSHTNGTSSSTTLATGTMLTAPVANTYMTFSIAVTPTTITFNRTDDGTTAIVATDSTYRGGYMQLSVGSSNTGSGPTWKNIVVA